MMIFTAIVKTPNSRNLKDVESETPIEAAILAAKTARKECTVHIVDTDAWARKFPSGKVGHWEKPSEAAEVNAALKANGQGRAKPEPPMKVPDSVLRTIENAKPEPPANWDAYKRRVFRRTCTKAAKAITKNRNAYPMRFCLWLLSNWGVWYEFYLAAEVQRTMEKRKRFSARAIIQDLRWETSTKDTDHRYKINNIYTPSLARLYNAVTGRQFFKTRATA